MPCRHLLNELFQQEADVVLARRGFLIETKMHWESFVNPAVSKDLVENVLNGPVQQRDAKGVQ